MFQNPNPITLKKAPVFVQSLSTYKNQVENQLEVDTDITNLSSRKLWQILKLGQIPGCELDPEFIGEVKNELKLRKDYDNGVAWNEPH